MTERQFKVSLSELHKTKKFVAMAGEKDFDYCLFDISYQIISGMPLYELRFPEESTCMDICATNAVDIIAAANEYFEVVLLP